MPVIFLKNEDKAGGRTEKIKTETDRKEVWVMAENKGYNGKHDNKGTQIVKAPNGGSGTTSGNVVHRGKDLRTGKK